MALLFTLVVAFLVLNMPVFIALIAPSALALLANTSISTTIVLQRMFAGVNKFSLLAIPFFIFAANVMNRGGLAKRMLDFAQTLVGHLPGGLAHTVVITCMFLGAVSGSAPATVVAVCSIMLPVMVENGYGKLFSVGLIMAASSVAVVIPPSIGMIVYGTVTNVSIGKLFMAGFIPGIIYSLVFIIYSFCYAKTRHIPVKPRAGLKEIGEAFRKAIWALGIPILIIIGVYGGIFTPIESAGIVAVYAIIISVFVHKDLKLREVYSVAYTSAVGTAQIMIILASASVFAWVLTRYHVPDVLTSFITSFAKSRFSFLLFINILLLIAGMFLDAGSIQTIMSPLLLPIALKYGIDPVHLGIIMVVNGAIGMFTPPFGLNLFVAAGITRIPLKDLMRSTLPWIVLSCVALGLITYIPSLSLCLVSGVR